MEIKCPFCKKGDSLDDASSDKRFYLTKGSDVKLKLDTKHMYYYQVQTQLGVCQLQAVVHDGKHDIFLANCPTSNHCHFFYYE